jgi:hypothetical protein
MAIPHSLHPYPSDFILSRKELMERFASLDDFTAQEQELKNTRQFVGDGSPFLEVPELQAVARVRVGHQELALEEAREYVTSTAPAAPRRVEVEPLVLLERRSDGMPVLLRSVISNDGRWQQGVPIFITGEWTEQPAESTKAKSGK